MPRFGSSPPRLVTPVPGPASRALATRLAAVESRNITHVSSAGPIFWAEARGANVRDVDGNVYVDLTAGFSVAGAGHANRRVARAVARQSTTLGHALGDVHPAEVKVRLLERLAALAPGELGVTILAGAGAEAVEAALKTALLHTGRPGILAFGGGYHGLTYGALAATERAEFREPFRAQLFGGVRFAAFPAATGRRADDEAAAAAALDEVDARLAQAGSAGAPVGAVLVEPVQGRGGIVVPPAAFLHGLRARCDGRRRVLIFDEVYTGFGRTGRWFACQHFGVEPDILVVGKALTGVLPLSAAIGRPAVMAAWPPSAGEAIHTSTFLGNPVACAAALANLEELERRDLIRRAARLGARVRRRLERWRDTYPLVAEARGLGLMQGAVLREQGSGRPAPDAAARVVEGALRRGVLMLTEGPSGNVLAVTPPFVITRAQLDHALDVVDDELRAAA